MSCLAALNYDPASSSQVAAAFLFVYVLDHDRAVNLRPQ